MKTLRAVSFFLFLATLAFAQRKQEYKTVYVSTNGSAVARVLTLQMPANYTKAFYVGQKITVYCEQACEFDIERDGAAATGGPSAPVKVNPSATWVAASTLEAYSGSNAGVGTSVGGPYVVAAGREYPVDISKQVMEKNLPSVQNITVRVSAVAGRVIIREFHEERAVWP